jgi:DHA2 family multidrug resistance protein-like MFS transporter
VPPDKSGAAGSGLSDLFLGRTENVDVRFAAAVALLFNVLMAIVALLAIAITVPRADPRTIA